MKIRFSLLSLFAVAVVSGGCSKSVTVARLSPAQSSALQLKLQTGAPFAPGMPLEADWQAQCDEFKRALGADITQGTVSVPEDWDDPQSAKINVFYYTRIIKDSKTAPIVFFNGGPASNSHGGFSSLAPIALAKNLTFVFIDQRGTGCSDQYPNQADEATMLRLSHYGTRAIVKDAETIRRTLFGNAKWRAFGQSYGGGIVHRYVMTAPEGLEAAFSHGASLMNDIVEWGVHRIRSQKRVANLYFEQYPNDLGVLEKVRGQIPDDTCYTDHVSTICGKAVLDAFSAVLAFQSSWGTMHSWLNALLKPDGTLAEEILAQFANYFVFGIFANNALGGSVISKLEMSPGYSDGQFCANVLSRLEKNGEAPQSPMSWPINECRLLSKLTATWYPLLEKLPIGDHMTPVAMLEALKRSPTLRFFFYSGHKDVMSPVEGFAEEVQTLGALATYRDFPESGHEGFRTESQVWVDLTSSDKRD